MRHIACSFFLAVSLGCSAQTMTYESVRLSELFLEASWETIEQTLPIIISGVENEFRKVGASERVSSVFPAQLRKTFTRESVGKAMAVFLNQSLTSSEIRDLDAFLRTSLGRKYLKLTQELGNSPAFIAQLLKPACQASLRELTAPEDRRTVEQLCPR